jgi:hypothetical protein
MPNFPVCFHNLAYNTGTPTQYNILMQICIVILNLVHLTYPPVVTHFSYLTDQDIFLAIQTSTFHTSHIYYSILLSPFLFNAFVSVFCTSLVSVPAQLGWQCTNHNWWKGNLWTVICKATRRSVTGTHTLSGTDHVCCSVSMILSM